MAGPSESHGHRGVAAGVPALPPSMRDRVPFLLYRASQISQSLASEMLAEMALNARQAGILTMVTELEPMTQKALADALRIDRTTMVTLLDDLEDKGYVVRQRHPRDRRAFLVHPTDSGRSAQAAAVRILDEQQRRFLAPLTPAERSQLAALLTRLHGRPAPGELRRNRLTCVRPQVARRIGSGGRRLPGSRAGPATPRPGTARSSTPGSAYTPSAARLWSSGSA